MRTHIRRGVQFGFLYGVLYFAGILGIAIWHSARYRVSNVEGLDSRFNIQVDACIAISYAVICGLEGSVAGALAGRIRRLVPR